MKEFSEPVTTKILNNRTPLVFGKFLNSVPDIPCCISRFDGIKSEHKAVIGDSDETLCAAIDLAHRVHARCVSMPAVNNDRHIDIDDVAIFHWLIIGNTVTDNVIDRGADGMLITAIPETGWHAAIVYYKFKSSFIERGCCNPGLYHWN